MVEDMTKNTTYLFKLSKVLQGEGVIPNFLLKQGYSFTYCNFVHSTLYF